MSGRGLFRLSTMAPLMTLALISCGGLSERPFETESGTWVLFTQPRFLSGGREAQILGILEMDAGSGCVYLHQPEFEFSYPVVWPHGTAVTETGLRLRDGREILVGEWVKGGGGSVSVNETDDSDEARVLERCPGTNNEYGEVAVFDSRPARSRSEANLRRLRVVSGWCRCVRVGWSIRLDC